MRDSGTSQLGILQVSIADILGGAERVGWDLFRTYRSWGYASWLAVGQKRTADSDVLVIPNQRRQSAWERLCRALHDRLEPLEGKAPGVWRTRALLRTYAEFRRGVEWRLGIEDFNYSGCWRLLALPPQRPDIIHAHNLHRNYFDLRSLPMLSHQVPFVLTLHDAWLLSGHCAHAFGCERWRSGCGHCPDLSISPAIHRDATAYNWRRKRRIFARSRLHVATPSRWLMDQVKASMLGELVADTRVIPNAVDLETFHPTDKAAARARLGLPQAAFVLTFAANGIRRNAAKDYRSLRSAVELLAGRGYDREILFLALGEEAPHEQMGRAEVRFVPYIADPASMARYYQASDVYLHGARAEVWGLTITEALACGAPVIATSVGGIPEQVNGLRTDDGEMATGDARHDREQATGFLVPAGNAHAIAACVETLLKDEPLRVQLGRNAAGDARRRFDLRRQANDYLGWYREILERSRAERTYHRAR